MGKLFRNTLAAFLAAFFLCTGILPIYAAEELSNLYALSAVLMDGKSGRILFEKDGDAARPNASTTKILTCILAIENAPGDDYVQVSKRAASQPEVKLGMSEGEQYYLEDLLYSLMLKSHNDSAVAIAEHIGGTVENFAKMMNRKAIEIGCKDTHFVTPNGLDEEDENGEHHTTAADLCLILRYCIKNPVFLHITRTKDYSFSDLSGKRSYSFHNTNALFDMTDGVISGKTGFTGKAGYCYVGACEKNDKCFIFALLGCGWPNHKNYKWKDSIRLLNYGDQNYFYQKLEGNISLPPIPVVGGEDRECPVIGKEVYETLHIKNTVDKKEEQILLRKDEKITCRAEIPDLLTAPVEENQEIGTLHWYIDGKEWRKDHILADYRIDKISFLWCFRQMFYEYFA